MMNRRVFFAAGAAGLSSSHLFGDEFADRKIKVGLIGTGWYGKIDLLRLIQVAPVEVVSLCDPDQKMLADAAQIVAGRQKSGKSPRTYADYRKMLAEKDLDLVLIGSPDHWHALHAITAMESGADLYLQKPISSDIAEGEAILATARKLGRVVQVGMQRRSTPHLIEAKDRVISQGLLGKVGHIDLYCYYHMRNNDNAPDIKPPGNLDYDLWTGPAPMRPFNRIVHPRGWRAFMEYGNGIVGDMCVHMLDMVRWMLDLGWPKTVSSNGGILIQKQGRANISDTQSALFDFGGLTASWEHRTYGAAADPEYPWGATIYGEKGTLKLSVNKFEFFPNGRNKATVSGTPLFEFEKYPEDKTEKDLEQHVASAVRVHQQDLLRAIVKRSKPVSDIEQGHISTASCILANMAMKLGRSLAYDPLKKEIAGDPEANKLLIRPYRDPYSHPGLVKFRPM